MKISKQARRDAKSLFKSCQVNSVLEDSRVRQAVTQIVAQKPRGQVGILHHFHRLVKLDIARRTAKVESAAALSPALQSGIQANLAARYGAGLNLTFEQNPALLGGLRVQVGSDVIDGSIQARLNALNENF